MNRRSIRLMAGLLVVLAALAGPLRAQSLCDAPSPRREMRAVWLTVLGGLDWPRHKVRTPADTLAQQAELCRTLDALAAAGFNTVLFQARIRGTVVYPSALEPWDGALTGQAGRSPGYDPLAFAVRECHRRGLELHAWLVAFPLGRQGAMRRLGRAGLAAREPALCRRAGDEWFLDPGVPATADYLARLCAEVAGRYDVDGIHLDYIRYPEHTIPFDDRTTWRRYGHGRERKAWRRDNVSRVVQAVSRSVKAVKPWVRLSCSPVGKYAALPRYDSYGWDARNAVSQDAAEWVARGWMDVLLPMMYFTGRHFYPFAVDWCERVGSRHVVAGLAAYMLDEHEKDWELGVLTRQMHFLRALHAGGQAYFRSRFVTSDVKGLYAFLRDDFYATPALTPALGPDSVRPAAPRLAGSLSRTALRLTWRPDSVPPGGLSYNIYRCAGPVFAPDSAQLLRAALRDTTCCLSALTPWARRATYAVTATDRWGRESLPAVFTPEGGAASGRSRAETPTLSGASPTLFEQTPTLCLQQESRRVALPPIDGARLLIIDDAVGHTVAHRIYRPQVDLSFLQPGIYTLRTAGGKRFNRTHRLVTLRLGR